MVAEFEGMDTMFSVKLPPWHGRGTVLQDNPGVEEAIKLAGLEWGVEGQALYLSNDEKVPGFKAIVRATDSRVLGVVTNRYQILQNAEAFDWFAPLVEEGSVVLETAGSLQDGKKVWILAGVVGAEEEVRRGDVVKQNILLAHSHDGTMSVRSGFCATRVVCANTLRMAENEGSLGRIRHTASMKDNLTVAREVLREQVKAFHASMVLAREMAYTPIAQQDIQPYIATVLGIKYNPVLLARRMTQIEPLVKGGRGNGQGSVWDLYNGVTEFLNYVQGRDQDSRLSSLWFGDAANCNARAWVEAVKLAA